MCIYEEPVYLTSAYTRRVKEPIHLRLHPNNINRDSEIDIPEAWNKTVFKKLKKNFVVELSMNVLQRVTEFHKRLSRPAV